MFILIGLLVSRSKGNLEESPKPKGATLTDYPFFIWWRRREFESSLSLDRPPLRFGHPRHTGAGSAVTAAKTKKGHLR